MQFGLIEAVSHWGRYRPDKVALISNHRPINYSTLLLKAENIAQAILDTTSGRRVAVATGRKTSFIAALLGVMRAGRSAVVLNPLLPEDEFGVTIDDTKPDAIVQDRDAASRLPSSTLISVPRVIVDALENHSSRNIAWPDYKPTDEWGIVFSSGSTGTPKGIERDHNSMITEIIGWSLELPLTKDSVFYIGRPIFYTGGLVLSLSSLFVGGTIITNDYRDGDDPEEVWSDYERESEVQPIEWAFFVPDQLRAFTTAKHRLGTPGKSILVMGAPITGAEKRAARDVLGSQIVESWGNSESLGTITEPEDLDLRPNSVGRPFLTDALFVVDDNLDICKPGEIGRLAGAETAGFREYSNRPEATNAVKRKRLIISDDIAHMDEEGYFYVKGRVQDLVVQGSTTVYLSDIEDELRKHRYIKEAAVCAIDDDKVEIVAAIVPSQELWLTAEKYCVSLNSKLDAAQSLSRVVLMTALPHLPSGKVDRLELRRQILKADNPK